MILLSSCVCTLHLFFSFHFVTYSHLIPYNLSWSLYQQARSQIPSASVVVNDMINKFSKISWSLVSVELWCSSKTAQMGLFNGKLWQTGFFMESYGTRRAFATIPSIYCCLPALRCCFSPCLPSVLLVFHVFYGPSSSCMEIPAISKDIPFLFVISSPYKHLFSPFCL